MDRSSRSKQMLAPPRAAAIAGLVFSSLMIVSLAIIRLALPGAPTAEGRANPIFGTATALALYLVPFAGIAFLWFLGVLRSRIGGAEDQFFATVFLGSGLLFAASLFASAAVARAAFDTAQTSSFGRSGDEVYYFARQVSYAFLNIFGVKMAAVFIFSTCVIALRTAILPRWIVFSGFACGLAL